MPTLPALLALGRFLQERDRAIVADTARLMFSAQRRAETIADRIQGTAQLHFGLARVSDLQTVDRDACSAFLSKVRETYPQYTGTLTIKPDGPSALAVIEQGEDLDLLFTDVVMPGGMNGRALADAARQVRPGLRVLYTSGYTENALVHHGRLDAGALLLTKPYRRSDLDRAIRSALDKGRVSS
ncbi:MAG: response regulator [Caldimonas sp.]